MSTPTEMNAVAVDIKDKLVTLSQGTFKSTSDWGIYIGMEPALPNLCLTVYDAGGSDPEYFLDRAKPPIENKNFQIIVRANDYLTAHAKAERVKTALEKLGSFTVNLTGFGEAYYGPIFASGDIMPLGKDENQRWSFSINFTVKRELVEA